MSGGAISVRTARCRRPIASDLMKKPSAEIIRQYEAEFQDFMDDEESDVEEDDSKPFALSARGKSASVVSHGKYEDFIFVDEEGWELDKRGLLHKGPEKVVKMGPPEPLQKILQFLSSDGMNVMAIWGPPGAGKSIIIQILNDYEEVAAMFDIVIWVKVATENTKEMLQLEIAKRLELNLQDNAEHDTVAESITEELIDKKYLLLLNDVKDIIDLQEIGIPHDKNGSKVVLTTESHHVSTLMADLVINVPLALISQQTDAQDVARDQSRKVHILEWVFVVSNLTLELPSAALDQLSSPHKPLYVLIGMVLSLLALLLCIFELVYRGLGERVTFKWPRGMIPWFYYPSRSRNHKHFGNFTDIIGFVCAIGQCIVTAINYDFSRRAADSPIKFCFWPIIFAFGLLCSRILESAKKKASERIFLREHGF